MSTAQIQFEQNKIDTSPRIGLPDVLKGLAVIFMVQVHLMELFASHLIYTSMPGKISLFFGGPPAAPVFMAVMGYFVAMSRKSFTGQMYRGVKLILLGFLVNIGMNLHLFIEIYRGTFELNPWKYVFGVDILFLAGLSIIFTAVFKLIFKEKLLFWVLAIGVFGSLNQFLPEYAGDNPVLKYALPYFSGFYPWAYFPVFPWMTYVLVGFTFQLALKKNLVPYISSQLGNYIFIALIVILLLTYKFGFRISTILEVYYHHNFVFVLWTIAFLAFWLILFDHLHHFFGTSNVFKYLKWVGKNVTAFYVIQWLIIGNIATEVFGTQHLFQLMLWFVAIMLVTSLLVLAIQKSKILR